ncbi:MAG: SulP family inorganic anion transporter [Anaerolineales bacterium]
MQNITNTFDQLEQYLHQRLPKDVKASLSVAMIAIPQAMAYASIVGVSPIYGLYAAMIPPVVASFVGSSDHVVTGPTITTALITSAVLVPFIGQENYPEYVFALAILSGLMRVVMGLLNLDYIIRYVSNAVVTGFLTGASILIVLNQTVTLLGLPPVDSHQTHVLLIHLFENLNKINFIVLSMGLFAIISLFWLQRLWPKLPASLLVILLTSFAAQIFGLDTRGVTLIQDLGNLSQLGLRFHIPTFPLKDNIIQTLLIGAGAVALLDTLEDLTIAKSIGYMSGQRVDTSRELVGQGLASIAGGFFQSLPPSGSLTRSAINYEEGATSRVANGLSGVFVFAAFLFIKRWVGYIPLVSLTGVVIISALHLIDRHQIEITLSGRNSSKIVFAATFTAVLFLPLYLSIYLGTILSILFYLYQSSRVKLGYLQLNKDGKFVKKGFHHIPQNTPETAVIDVEGDLYFAAAEDLADALHQIMNVEIEILVLRMRRTRLLASTAIRTLEAIQNKAASNGTTIVLCGVSEQTMAMLRDCGLAEQIGDEHIFPATEIPYASTRQALDKAYSKVNSESQSRTSEPVMRTHHGGPWPFPAPHAVRAGIPRQHVPLDSISHSPCIEQPTSHFPRSRHPYRVPPVW